MQDPKFKNETLSGDNAFDYLQCYSQKLQEALSKVDKTSLDQACSLVEEAAENGQQIYVAGNGGSAAIADHLCCDWVKGTFEPGHPRIRVQSLISNSAVLTAFANDYSYEESIAKQIQMIANQKDLLILISSSGSSKNIVCCAKAAKEKGMTVIGLSGFTGGALKETADVSLHVPMHNYGIVEDCHQMLMHVIAQFIDKKRRNLKK